MLKNYLVNKVVSAIKQCGVGGLYIFIEEGVELKDGTIINEVRLSSNGFSIEFLEKGTNKVIRRISKKDMEKIYHTIF